MSPLSSVAARSRSSASAGFDVERVRRDFPILQKPVHGRPLVYLDNVATTQKPQVVIDTLVDFYTSYNSNVHRGVYNFSIRATDEYERARAHIQRFLGAGQSQEIIFVRGTTEAINLVAQSYARPRLKPGDEVVITAMEHHSNIVPWQLVCQQTGAALRVVPITDDGALRMDEFVRIVEARTKIVAAAHVSNALGTINPIQEMVQHAHRVGAVVLIDGAQSVPHFRVDVRDLGCDFFCFSGHKAFGPTGIGALFVRREVLDSMAPYQGGGDMIRSVTFEKTTYNDLPYRFEAGTPNVADTIALAAAIDYIDNLGMEAIAAYEHELLEYGTEVLQAVPGLRIIGTARHKAPVISFVLDQAHAHDVGTILDQEGIAVRTGHHCAQPVMDRFGVSATVRASMAFYNTKGEIDALVEGLRKVAAVFA